MRNIWDESVKKHNLGRRTLQVDGMILQRILYRTLQCRSYQTYRDYPQYCTAEAEDFG